MKNILLSTLTIFAIGSFAIANSQALPQSNDPAVKSKADQQLKLQNKEIVKLVVAELGSKLPQTVDKYTQFTDIKAEGLKLLYTYEINTGSKSDEAVRRDDKKRMESFIVKGICQSSRRFLESNINLAYIYNSANTKAELFRFDVTQSDCKSFWQ